MTAAPRPGRSFPEALAYAMRGLRYAARTQRHLRVQLLIATAALAFAAWADLPVLEIAVIAVMVAVVLGAELMNTAVEGLTDLVHPDHGAAAAVVKDAAAAAVLIVAAIALAVGLVLLVPHLIRSPAAGARAVSAALGAACFVIFLAGAMHGPRAARP